VRIPVTRAPGARAEEWRLGRFPTTVASPRRAASAVPPPQSSRAVRVGIRAAPAARLACAAFLGGAPMTPPPDTTDTRLAFRDDPIPAPAVRSRPGPRGRDEHACAAQAKGPPPDYRKRPAPAASSRGIEIFESRGNEVPPHVKLATRRPAESTLEVDTSMASTPVVLVDVAYYQCPMALTRCAEPE